jgi:glycerophosphoryl diester phosphodiesterase
MKNYFLLNLVIALAFSLTDHAPYMTVPGRKMVVAHRGDCGQFPEHTAVAYTSAHYAGADFNELDLQVTKDGRLVISHNPVLKETNNIGCSAFPEFCSRQQFLIRIDDTVFTNDFLVNDFTWEEL